MFHVSVGGGDGQLLSRIPFFATSWPAVYQSSLSFTVSRSLLKFMSVESGMPSNHLILCCPLLLLISVFPNTILFSSEPALCIRWPKYWSFKFSIIFSNEYSGLISLRVDWFELLFVQGPLRSSPALQLKSINSLALSLLYGPALTSVNDSRKNHSFDYTDLCWQTDEMLVFLGIFGRILLHR